MTTDEPKDYFKAYRKSIRNFIISGAIGMALAIGGGYAQKYHRPLTGNIANMLSGAAIYSMIRNMYKSRLYSEKLEKKLEEGK